MGYTTAILHRCFRCQADIEAPSIETFDYPGPREICEWDICEDCDSVISGDERESIWSEIAVSSQLEMVEMLKSGSLEDLERAVREPPSA